NKNLNVNYKMFTLITPLDLICQYIVILELPVQDPIGKAWN
ncbi:26407_t:CDS:1, partial [Gigaspora margarita]